MITAVVYYLDATENLYRKNIDLSAKLYKEYTPLKILHGRFSACKSYDTFILLLPDTLINESLAQEAELLGIKVKYFSSSSVLEKPIFLRQQYWDLEDDSGNETLIGEPLAELVESERLEHLILVPLTNILVDAQAVLDSFRVHNRQGFDVSFSVDRIAGANWMIFTADLLRGLLRTHPDLMRARGALAWILLKPLYPFKRGNYNCPRIRPRLNVDLRLNSLRAWTTISESIQDIENFASVDFSYEKWLNTSNWEEKYMDFGPKSIYIEPTNMCNASCYGCPHKNMQRERQHMGTAVLEQIRAAFSIYDDCKWTFGGMGEPLLHPNISDIVGLSKRHCSMLITSLQTAFPADFPFGALNQIRISVDSCLPGEFELVRQGCDWEQIKEFLAKAKDVRDAGQAFPEVGVTMVRNGQTEQILQTFLNYYKRAVKPVFKENFFIWPYDEIRGTVSWYQILGEADYFGGIAKTGTVDFEPVKRRVCRNMALTATILSNGEVTFCPFDFEGRYSVGNLHKAALPEIWNSEAYRHLRHEHLKFVSEKTDFEPCSGCHDWYHYL